VQIIVRRHIKTYVNEQNLCRVPPEWLEAEETGWDRFIIPSQALPEFFSYNNTDYLTYM